MFGSAEQSEEMMNCLGVSQTVRQISKGAFRSDLVTQSTGQVDFFADRFNKAVSLGRALPVDYVGFMFPRSANGDFRVSGRDVGTAKLVCLAGGQGINTFASDLVGSENIVISAQRFEALRETLCLEQTAIRSDSLNIFDGDAQHLQRLRLATLAASGGGSMLSDEERVDNLLSELVAWIGDSSGLPKWERSPTRAARSHVAKLAQEYIEEHYREKISIENICRVTATGIRTLQRCFLQRYGITISEYVKTVRFEGAYRDLAAGHFGEDTVAKIASSHGIAHFGRFAVEYRERYGESPSVTLAKRQHTKCCQISWCSPPVDRKAEDRYRHVLALGTVNAALKEQAGRVIGTIRSFKTTVAASNRFPSDCDQ